jgi:hypothetical protein
LANGPGADKIDNFDGFIRRKGTSMARRVKFELRKFISFSVFLAFSLLALSGVTMFLRPEGSIARWTGWEMLWLNKKGWEAVHVALAALFVLVAAAHIILNRKALWRYLKDKVKGTFRFGRELAAAGTLVLAVLVFAVLLWWPASGLMDLRSAVKDGRGILDVAPPALDADKLPLTEIAKLTGVETGVIVRGLSGLGYRVEGPADTLENIAKGGGVTPEKLYLLILRGFPGS